jgi:hypothetical protein
MGEVGGRLVQATNNSQANSSGNDCPAGAACPNGSIAPLWRKPPGDEIWQEPGRGVSNRPGIGNRVK